ncbi:hypothetical protein [Sphaerisporangium fuscum]|uniref:hypothetical protein n=1 Tax=Sphaerisporangium fuscum TaxID=2835868 RepID=UPI001BDCA602|nr:hypothetical protein [Sphaerisporangium fuscum]
MTTTDKVANATTATAHLQALGEVLQSRGLHVRVGATAGGLPQLIVISTAVPTLSEVILAAQRDGRWWFWWSWAERIAPIDDMATAVTQICRALTPAGDRDR